MRKQYFFRESPEGLLAWDVDRLIELTAELPRVLIPLEEIGELDRVWAGNEGEATWRDMVEHMRLVSEADMSFPIIIAANGEIMDGRHRIAKALLQNLHDIVAVRFEEDPEPDYVNVSPDDLPY